MLLFSFVPAMPSLAMGIAVPGLTGSLLAWAGLSSPVDLAGGLSSGLTLGCHPGSALLSSLVRPWLCNHTQSLREQLALAAL